MTRTLDPQTPLVNGVDTKTLMATVNAIKADPGLGTCRFRARNSWLSGNHNRSVVAGFFGARQEIAHTRVAGTCKARAVAEGTPADFGAPAN